MDEKYEELLDKVNKLQAENNSILAWQGEITKALRQMVANFEKQNERMSKLQEYAYINRLRIDSLPFEMRDTEYKTPFFIPKVMSPSETRREVIDKKKSISRFGDGEFGVIAGVGRWNFQSASEELAKKLLKVLYADDEGMIIGINRLLYGNLEELSEVDADGIRAYMKRDVREQHMKLLNSQKIYGNALMNEINSEESLSELREIWNERDCVFIEGKNTGMGVGNDLFDNCRSIERIIAPSENAINRYNEIMEAAVKQPKHKLILLALGPTATALSYDLFKEGYQAVDIGHIDLYYEKYIRKLPNLQDVSIPFKYCSWDEVGERRAIDDITDPIYKGQIVEMID